MRLRAMVVAGVIATSGLVATPPAGAAEVGVLAVAGADGLTLVPTDGTRTAVVAGSASWAVSPSWSPDGQRIAYSTTTNPVAVGEVHTVARDGGDDRVLVRLPGQYVYDTTWSPDGERIAFSAQNSPTCWGCPPVSNVYVVGADGKGLAPVTVDGLSSEPAWSPDGSSLAYSGGSGIYVTDPSVPVPAKRISPLDVTARGPVWSPEGTRIAYTGSELTDGLSATPTIRVASADGSTTTVLDNETYGGLSWSPDSRSIVYEGAGGIFTVASDGSATRRLTASEEGYPDFSPTWSPGGELIAFFRWNGSGNDLWLVSPDGKDETHLGQGPWQPEPVWAPTPVVAPAGTQATRAEAQGAGSSSGSSVPQGRGHGGGPGRTSARVMAATAVPDGAGSSRMPLTGFEPGWAVLMGSAAAMAGLALVVVSRSGREYVSTPRG